MASTSLTLYKDSTNTEVFSLGETVGKRTTYDGDESTPTFPVAYDITRDRKNVGNMSNDRYIHTIRRSSAATGRGSVATSSAELKVSVGKDPVTGAALELEARYALSELVSVITGTAPTTAQLANIAAICMGQLV